MSIPLVDPISQDLTVRYEILGSRFGPGIEQFEANRTAMEALVVEKDRLESAVLGGGGDKYVARHRGRGKMLVRELVELLIDDCAPLLELSVLAGFETGDPLGAGVLTAIGEVNRRQCVILANDATVQGGAHNPSNITKMLRAYEIAQQNQLPLIALIDSAGADLPRQSEIFVRGSAQFRLLAELSAQGVPVIAVVLGNANAGAAYAAAMSDYTIFVQNNAHAYLGGAPLVKLATNEIADVEELGGADMHARTSGLCDYLAADELDALRIARRVFAETAWTPTGPRPLLPVEEPRYDAEELLGCASVDLRVPFDVREILARVVDGSRFGEFKQQYGSRLVCGWASIGGYPIGVIANNGILFSEEARKGAQFIQTCDRRRIPLLFVQNITGFMVGTSYEQGGIIKDGAKLINAVSNATVPKITLMVGASYGAGNFAMSGRGYQPRFTFTWPNSRIAVMGGKQLAGVMRIIRENAAAQSGRSLDEAAVAAEGRAIEEQLDRESRALFATGRQWDDGIIDPRDTRTVLAIALAAVHSQPFGPAGVMGVERH